MPQRNEFQEQLLDRISLAAVVAKKVDLKKRGREYIGLCPFHSEKTPSFTVAEDKGFYHCFGCGASGNAISFVMQIQKMNYREALEELANMAGMQVPEFRKISPEKIQERENDYQLLAKASDYFHQQLFSENGRQALNYLHQRGINLQTIKEFALGFAPADSQDMLNAPLFQSTSPPLDALQRLSLIRQSQNDNSYYAFFRNRIIFPIQDNRGRTIAFGGRTILNNPDTAKYINSADTPLFNKSKNLYNQHRAKKNINHNTPLIVAEGYMDVIVLHQHELPASVAPLGTAITEEQIQQLWKITDEPLIALDGDNAGRKAAIRTAIRAIPTLQAPKSLRFLFLPEGEDPDSYCQKQGSQKLLELTKDAQNLAELLWQSERDKKPLSTPEQKADLEARLNKITQQIKDSSVQKYYQKAFREYVFQTFAPKFKRKSNATQITQLPRLSTLNQKINQNSQTDFILLLAQFPQLLNEHYEELVEFLDNGLDKLLEDLLVSCANNPESNFATLSQLMQTGPSAVLWKKITDPAQQTHHLMSQRKLKPEEVKEIVQNFISNNNKSKQASNLSKDLCEHMTSDYGDGDTADAWFKARAELTPSPDYRKRE